MAVNENDELETTWKEFESIPFIELLYPYANLLYDSKDLPLSNILKNKLKIILLKELSRIGEVTLQCALDNFIKNGGDSFCVFVEKLKLSFADDYPVLDRIFYLRTINFFSQISKIINRFQKDYENIIYTFYESSPIENLEILDIGTGLGDVHNGEETSLILLSDGTKLIYKPRNVSITEPYNFFINWVNHRLNINLKTFRVLDCGDYGWLEFVNHKSETSKQNLQEYYYKAGILSAITLLIGSRDCHRENIIASSKNPVLIDHETIISPILQSSITFIEQQKTHYFSVLESLLITNINTGVNLNIAGYGINRSIEESEIDKKILNPNTINSKRVVSFNTRNMTEKNVPVYMENIVFVKKYQKHFNDGFCSAYDLFLDSKIELKSQHSPLRLFNDIEVRFLWRSTYIYSRILKYMRSIHFMSSFEVYEGKLHELLSKAYHKEGIKDYKSMLNFEMKQMMNGDIPIFNINSLDNSLKHNKSFKFKYNCIENINYRIDLFSPEHKREQLEYITQWANM